MSVVFVRETKPNQILKSSEISDKKWDQLAAHLNLAKGKEVLVIETPFYREKPKPGSKLDAYPELTLASRPDSYPPPPYYLRAVPEKESFALVLDIKTQLPQTFPPFKVPFIPSKDLKVSQFLEICVAKFGLKCQEPKLFLGDQQIDGNEKMDDIIPKCRQHRLTFECTVDQSEVKRINQRDLLAKELVSSEQAFVNDLKVLTDYWKPNFESLSKFFEPRQIYTLFRDIPIIFQTHNSLLKMMQTQPPSYASCFGGVFLNKTFIDKFKLSAAFVSNYNKMSDLIQEKKKQKSFDSKLQELEENNEASPGRQFLGYYITPVQRYPRYPLLIRDLIKNTPDFHPDKPYLIMAQNSVDSINKDIDNTTYRVKQLLLLKEIQKVLPESFTVFDHGREILQETQVRITKPKAAPAVLYLFNDIVVLALKTKKIYQIKVNASIMDFRFLNCYMNCESFAVVLDDGPTVITFADYSEKLQWMGLYNSLRQNEFANPTIANFSILKWTDVEYFSDSSSSSLPGLHSHSSAFCNQKAYFFCGKSSGTASSTLLTFEPSEENNMITGKWTASKLNIKPRSFHTSTTIKDSTGKEYIYLIFGQSAKDSAINDILKFDPETNEVTKITPKSSSDIVPRYSHSAIAWNQTIVIFGGKKNENTFLNTVGCFDTTKEEYYELDVKVPPTLIFLLVFAL